MGGRGAAPGGGGGGGEGGGGGGFQATKQKTWIRHCVCRLSIGYASQAHSRQCMDVLLALLG